MEGSFKVEVAPFPKSQNQLVGLPPDWSVKLTTSGEQPEVTAAVKLAFCAREQIVQHRDKKVRMVDFRINLLSFRPFYGSFRKVVSDQVVYET